MKKIPGIVFAMVLLYGQGLYAIDDNKEVSTDSNGNKSPYTTGSKSFSQEAFSSGQRLSKITFFGGYHKHLYSYTDERYRGDDKGDYISTDSQQAGLEVYGMVLKGLHPSLEDLRGGLNLNFYRHGKISPRTLYAVPLHSIDAETVPSGYMDQIQEYFFDIGIFAGIDKKWYAVDLGFTFRVKAINEKVRDKLDPASDPANPTYIEVEGRGVLFEDSSFLPNFFFRLGIEKNPHLTFGIFRENYDPQYGIIQSKIVFPVSSYFTMKLGGYMYKTQSLFLEPLFSFKGFSLGLKAGIIINYNDDELTRVAIADSLFYSASISYEW